MALSPFHRPEALYSIAVLFSVLPTVFVLLRLHARRMIKAPISWDDWLVLFALFTCIGLSAAIVVDTALGNLGRHSLRDEYGHTIMTQAFFIHMHANTTIRCLTPLTFGATKLSVLFFYRRIFHHGYNYSAFDLASHSLFVITTGWTIGFFVANIFRCTDATYLAQAYLDTATDVCILVLPMPILWKLRLSTKKRFGLMSIFLLGAITTAASAWRAAIQHTLIKEYHEGRGHADVFYILTPSIISAVIEAALGIVGACLPLLRPLVRPLHLGDMRFHVNWHRRSKKVSEFPLVKKSGNGTGGTDDTIGGEQGHVVTYTKAYPSVTVTGRAHT
ncbi:hypothetical protein BDV95DRAFT_609178 [Massariosphaeria phaeospora]|uniref:Rhodopsin domain-containing protein n=1 Tax=Massariosphaeria phaeospora TaxID=100035 RepID=A0A7C8I453_9PLEO|nr:hypothetical protein BDV95DRAFT_609178 [Massariosphaeria phaeospora]